MDFDLRNVQNLVETFDAAQPTGDPFLDARYDAEQGRFPYWRFFYRLCQLYRPAMCCELGAWQGTCAAHMAAGGAGTVATIDHHGDPGDDAHERLAREAAQAYNNLFYFKMWTWDAVTDVKALGKKIDVLFIDSWHQYPYAMLDWKLYAPLLAHPALVVADDLLDGEGPTIGGMRRFWDEVSNPYESFLSATAHPGYPQGFMKVE